MPTIIIQIKDCSQCPNHKKANHWSTDGWDRMEDWLCIASNDRKVAGAVEWHDKVPVPDWCPLLLK
jgi:hypothetical protein